jgi:hypothetical protein
MLVYAPGTQIEVNSIRIGLGKWTSVMGVIEGTFMKPMPIPGGGSFPPSGKVFRVNHA